MVFQPENEYPVFVSDPVLLGKVMVEVTALTAAGTDPATLVFPLKVIVAFHCAYSVELPGDGKFVAPAA